MQQATVPVGRRAGWRLTRAHGREVTPVTNAPEPPTSDFLDVNGARLAYQDVGTGHPFILIHAGIADMRMWDDQVPVLARRYRVIRYDQRGFGLSSMPAEPFSARADLYGIMRALRIARAYVLGVSVGGRLAIDFTLEHPEMVDGLVAVAPGLSGFPWSDDDAQFNAEIEEAVRAGDVERANDIEVHMWVDGPNRTPAQVKPAIRERVRAMNAGAWARSAARECATEQPLDPPAMGRLGEIRVPALAIVGDEDFPDMRRTADALATQVPGARQVVMHGTAHVPNLERADEFNQTVLEFLDTIERQGAGSRHG